MYNLQRTVPLKPHQLSNIHVYMYMHFAMDDTVSTAFKNYKNIAVIAVPKLPISQSEAVSAVLISCDIDPVINVAMISFSLG